MKRSHIVLVLIVGMMSIVLFSAWLVGALPLWSNMQTVYPGNYSSSNATKFYMNWTYLYNDPAAVESMEDASVWLHNDCLNLTNTSLHHTEGTYGLNWTPYIGPGCTGTNIPFFIEPTPFLDLSSWNNNQSEICFDVWVNDITAVDSIALRLGGVWPDSAYWEWHSSLYYSDEVTATLQTGANTLCANAWLSLYAEESEATYNYHDAEFNWSTIDDVHIYASELNASSSESIYFDNLRFRYTPNVTIEGNWSGAARNYTTFAVNLSESNPSYFNFSQVLQAGTFSWKSYAIDSSGNWNTSDDNTFTINQASVSPILNITNLTSTYGQYGYYRITCMRPDSTSLADVFAASSTSTVNAIYNKSWTEGLSVYNISLTGAGLTTANAVFGTSTVSTWTGAGDDSVRIINTQDAYTTYRYCSALLEFGGIHWTGTSYNQLFCSPQDLYQSLNPTSYYLLNSYKAAPATGLDRPYLYKNYTDVDTAENGVVITPALGDYTYACNITGGNYTGSTTKILSIEQAASLIELYLNGTAGNMTCGYPCTSNVTGIVIAGDAGYQTVLYRNGTDVGVSNETAVLAAGLYNYTFVYNGSANYTTASVTRWLTTAPIPSINSILINPVFLVRGDTVNINISINESVFGISNVSIDIFDAVGRLQQNLPLVLTSGTSVDGYWTTSFAPAFCSPTTTFYIANVITTSNLSVQLVTSYPSSQNVMAIACSVTNTGVTGPSSGGPAPTVSTACGNNICEYGENKENCVLDCQTNFSFTVTPSDYFRVPAQAGETINCFGQQFCSVTINNLQDTPIAFKINLTTTKNSLGVDYGQWSFIASNATPTSVLPLTVPGKNQATFFIKTSVPENTASDTYTFNILISTGAYTKSIPFVMDIGAIDWLSSLVAFLNTGIILSNGFVLTYGSIILVILALVVILFYTGIIRRIRRSKT